MPSVIDQRIAALIHQQQVTGLARLERTAGRIQRHFRAALRDIVALASEVEDSETVIPRKLEAESSRRIAKAFEDAAAETRETLRSQIEWSHRTTTEALLASVPMKWFAALHPRLAWLAQAPGKAKEEAIERAREDVYDDLLQTRYEYEPIVPWQTAPKVTRDEAMQIIRATLFPPPSPMKARGWLQSAINGMTWEDRFRRYSEQGQRFILQELTAGVADGEAVRKLRKRLLPVVDNVTYKAQRIARTEGRRVAELAQQEATDSLGELVSGQQIVAVMDQWTRPEHAIRNGKVYRRQDDGQFVADDGERLPQLPDEPNCRCMAVPILATPKEFLNDPAMKAEFSNAAGDQIPDPAAYTQWFAQADDRERALAVGMGRYGAVLRRARAAGQQPEWTDFVDERGRLLGVRRLRRESERKRVLRKGKVAGIIGERERLFRQVFRSGMG